MGTGAATAEMQLVSMMRWMDSRAAWMDYGCTGICNRMDPGCNCQCSRNPSGASGSPTN